MIQFDVRRTKYADKEEILDFLKKHYFPDEPINKSMGGGVSEMEQAECVKYMNNEFSVMAVDNEQGNIIGVSLFEVYTKDTTNTYETKIRQCQQTNDTYGHVMRLFKKLDEDSNFWETIGTDRCLRSATVCVDRNHRNKKVASTLLEKVLTMASDFKFLRSEPTNETTLRIYMKQGWKVLMSYPFKDFLDKNGEQVFPTEFPNTHINLVYRRIEDGPNPH